LTIRGATLPRGLLLVAATVVAVVLGWRAVVAGLDAQRQRDEATIAQTPGAPGSPAADERWRARLATNPADATAAIVLALELERQGRHDEATAAMREAQHLAPGDAQTLLQAAAFQLRAGEDDRALHTLRRYVDISRGQIRPGSKVDAMAVFARAVDTRRHRDFFDALARENPPWWSQLFKRLCAGADVDEVQALFAVRVRAGLDNPGERRCLIERLQRDGHWTNAYLTWLNGLPLAQRQRVGYVFNGDFELPLSNLGFDWLTPSHDGVSVRIDPAAGATERNVLEVAFENRRYAGPPIMQYLLLAPAQYLLEGRARAEIETWIGLQWGLYCLDRAGRAARQLARTDRFIGSTGWRAFREAFTVSADCPVQVLRLELGNPRRDAGTPGNVVSRLNGRVWFDDLRVRFLDDRRGG